MKVFISQPMSGRTEEEIINERIETMGKIRMYFDEEVEILDTYMTDDFVGLLREENARKNNCLWADGMEYIFLLGSSITAMAKADAVWFVRGWHKSRGCTYEWCIACNTDMHMIVEDDLGEIIDSAKESK